MRPVREDVEAHRAWLQDVGRHLYKARLRHPFLVLRAIRWFIRSEHAKSVKIAPHEYYFPAHALMRVLSWIWPALASTRESAATLPRATDEMLWRAAKWIREKDAEFIAKCTERGDVYRRHQ